MPCPRQDRGRAVSPASWSSAVASALPSRVWLGAAQELVVVVKWSQHSQAPQQHPWGCCVLALPTTVHEESPAGFGCLPS